ncbi:ribonuclease H-like domain-containing protein, partial [Fomitopsis serialis]|uniref:ribonuclease H-like domain-containing protein n=1 Tax=Fomitopsis serialis TaxID=139415 RepID=UPI0020078F35
QIGSITMDGASANKKKMEFLQEKLGNAGIKFDADGNRAITDELEKNPSEPVHTLASAPGVTQEFKESCERYVDMGNQSNLWGPLENPVVLPEVQLLHDVDTRWSAMYNMISRMLILYPAVRHLIQNDTLSNINDLSDAEFDVLVDIHQVFAAPNAAQELLSAEKTPTLSMALPVFTELMDVWTEQTKTIPELQHYIDIGIDRVQKYVNIARSSQVYALAMIINPTSKMTWINAH